MRVGVPDARKFGRGPPGSRLRSRCEELNFLPPRTAHPVRRTGRPETAYVGPAPARRVRIEEITYPPTNFSDATTQVREAASADPDVIVGTGYYPDQLLVARAVRQLSPEIDALYA